jgi:hypothetical protein
VPKGVILCATPSASGGSCSVLVSYKTNYDNTGLQDKMHPDFKRNIFRKNLLYLAEFRLHYPHGKVCHMSWDVQYINTSSAVTISVW